jgi:hypothetical protein
MRNSRSGKDKTIYLGVNLINFFPRKIEIFFRFFAIKLGHFKVHALFINTEA